MAHKMTIKVSPALINRTTDGVEDPMMVISNEAATINETFTAEGKMTEVTETDPNIDDGSYVLTIKFRDSAACDEYLAAMAAIGEYERSGSSRSEFSREDI